MIDAVKFKQIVTPYYKEMYRVALAVTSSQEDAEDVVQEFLEKLWAKRNYISTVDNISSFLKVSIRRQAIDYIKKKRVEMISIEEQSFDVSSNLSADSELLQIESANMIDDMINHLPPTERSIMIMRTNAECSIDDIVQLTGMTQVSIRTTLSRARKRLRMMYEKSNR